MGRMRILARVLPGALGLVLLAGCEFPSLPGQSRADESILGDVSLTAMDAAPAAEYALVDHGDEVAGQVSLDLCRSDYPSEAQRVARHQVQIFNAAAGMWVSSEAIAYTSPDAAEQAMSELAAAAADCGSGGGSGAGPGQNVTNRVGVPAAPAVTDDQGLTWSFEDSPDADWPQTPGVTRQAYAFAISDQLGDSSSYVTTYLRRGRILLAVYVTPPDSAKGVLVNSPTQQRLVEVLSSRLAALPRPDVH